jgi:outer membrane receptor for ferrienterochelin and colicin
MARRDGVVLGFEKQLLKDDRWAVRWIPWFLLAFFVSETAQGEPEQAPDDGAEMSGESSAIEFTLASEDLSLVQLMERTVVSASATDESIARAPAVIDVITSEEISASGYRSLAEALQNRAGMDVLYDHYQPSLGIRGVVGGERGASRIVRVMIDGQPTAFRSSGENFLGMEAIPLSIVQRIEIIRGPASVIYGANAFLGVINIITKEGYQVDGGLVRTGYEGNSQLQNPWGEVLGGGEWGEISFVAAVSGESKREHGYPLVQLPDIQPVHEDELSEGAHSLNGSAYARLSWISERYGRLDFDGHFQQLNRDAEFSDWGPMAHDNRLFLKNGYGRMRYEIDWQQRLFCEVSAGLASGGPGSNDSLKVAPEATSHIERTLGYLGRDVSTRLRFELDELSHISGGVDSSWNTQTPLVHSTVLSTGERVVNPPPGATTEDIEFMNLGLHLNATLHPFELAGVKRLSDLGVSGGMRMDSHNIYGEAYSTRAGLVYGPGHSYYLKALYGSSFKAPASTQLYSNTIEPGGVIGNPTLRPERARTLEAAVGAEPFLGLTLRLSASYTRILDRIEIQQPPVTAPVSNERPENASAIDSLGAEAEVNWQRKNVTAFANYSFQQSDYQEEDLFSIDQEMVRVDTDAYPNHLIKAGISLDQPNAYFRGGVNLRWIGPRPGTQSNNVRVNGLDYLTERYRLPAYTMVDLRVSTMDLALFGARETRLSGTIRNVLGVRYTSPGYGGFDIPGPKRSYEISLLQEF